VLTKLTVRNFKSLESAEIELGNPVVFMGPNDSGKTSALQALALWDLGRRRWIEKRGGSAPAERSGVAINRRDLTAVPAPSARALWWDLRVRRTYRGDRGQRTENILVDVIVEGVTGVEEWVCGLEFDFANAESFHCRPLRIRPDGSQRMPVPDADLSPPVVLLGPMSGLTAQETKLEPGAISVRLGEGRTAEVLRNLCFQILEKPGGESMWQNLADRIESLFGARLDRPEMVVDRGEVELTYQTRTGSRLDLSASGRGMQQTLLLLTFIALHPGSVILLDEPDAHLEILRQREIFRLLNDAASGNGTQVIVASHSEIVLREAAERGTVVAFVGSPHRLNKSSEVVKSLREIGFEDYYLAETTGFVLYLEGSTDLDILQEFARLLEHDARDALENPFVCYVENQPAKARRHFDGLREAKPDLVGFALFDRLDRDDLPIEGDLRQQMWARREIENYLLPISTLVRYAGRRGARSFDGPLLSESESQRWSNAMTDAIEDRVPPAAYRDPKDAYWDTAKVSDDLLEPVLRAFFHSLSLYNDMPKAKFYELVRCLEVDEVHPDVVAVLDAIAGQQTRARPAR